MAWTASAISSPALTPTTPAPSMRRVPGSTITFVRPSGRPIVSARPEATQGKLATSWSMPSRVRLRLGEADPGDLGVGVGDRRDRRARRTRRRGRRSPRRPRRPGGVALWASIGSPTTSPMAWMCGHVGAHARRRPRSRRARPPPRRPRRRRCGRRWRGGRPPPGCGRRSAARGRRRRRRSRAGPPRAPRPPRRGCPGGSPRSGRRCACGAASPGRGRTPGMSWSSISTTVIRDAERVVDRGHLQADDAAADDEQALGHLLQRQRAGRVHDPRVVGEPGDARGLGSRGDDRSCANAIVSVAVGRLDLEVVRRR